MARSARLASRFSGRLFLPGDAGFEHACAARVFNLRRPPRRPAAVLQAADADDVVAGVALARSQGWQITVRSGGHSWGVWSLRDDALLIDMGAFTAIDYDAETGVVVAGPAVCGGSDLDPFLEGCGRFFNAGHCPTVGIGGFLLQGGMGWNCRGWGWAAESVIAIDVVTAAGQRLRCDEEQNADLFWASRGAGPGFPAIVTAFHLRTRPRFGALTDSKQVYPAELAPEVLSWLHEARWELDDTVELVAVSLDGRRIPELGHTGSLLVVDALSFADSHQLGQRALLAMESCPVKHRAIATVTAAPTELAALRAEQERANPEGHKYVVDNAYVHGPREEVIRRLVPAFSGQPTEKSFSIWFDMGRAPDRGLPDMALSLQADIYFAAYLVGETDDQVNDCLGWIEARADELEPVSPGVYLGDSDLARRPAKFISDRAYARLRDVQRRWDPEERFCSYLLGEWTPINTNRPMPRKRAEP